MISIFGVCELHSKGLTRKGAVLFAMGSRFVGHGLCTGLGLTFCWPWAVHRSWSWLGLLYWSWPMHGSWLGLYLPWALAGHGHPLCLPLALASHGLKLWIRMDLIGEVAMGSVRSW